MKTIKLNKKIYNVLRSMLRYTEFHVMKAPPMIINQEKRILKNYFQNLNIEDIEIIQKVWPYFHEQKRL